MPATQREAHENHPDQLELLCSAAQITVEAAAREGESEPVPRFTMLAYSGDAMRVEGWRQRPCAAG